jgi:predicted SAM-dependent methyltransferase
LKCAKRACAFPVELDKSWFLCFTDETICHFICDHLYFHFFYSSKSNTLQVYFHCFSIQGNYNLQNCEHISKIWTMGTEKNNLEK